VIAVRSGRTVPASIRQEGLLQPIGVTETLELVFGERRNLAVRDILKKKTMLARGCVQWGRGTARNLHSAQIEQHFLAITPVRQSPLQSVRGTIDAQEFENRSGRLW
jgi:hypothetical protein